MYLNVWLMMYKGKTNYSDRKCICKYFETKSLVYFQDVPSGYGTITGIVHFSYETPAMPTI